MDEFTDEIIEKARNSNTCPFCEGAMQVIDEPDDTHAKIYCITCSRTWIEVYDTEVDLVDMMQNPD